MESIDKVREFFNTDYPLNKEGLNELLSAFRLKVYDKNEMLLQAGMPDNHLRFLTEGTVREYYATEEKETNINFYNSPQFITDFSSFINSTKTRKYQECISKVEVLILEKDTFQKLLDKYQCGKSFIDATFQKLLEQKELFEYFRITKSPDELYKYILDSNPCWLQDVPQYHIASFLGVTPETLSRIRKRIS